MKEERDKALDNLDYVKKHLERVRKQRNEAEDQADRYKSQKNTLTKELRELRDVGFKLRTFKLYH